MDAVFLMIQGMGLAEWFSVVIIILLALIFVFLVTLLMRKTTIDFSPVLTRFEAFEKGQDRLERILREEIARNREESSAGSRRSREEISGTLNTLGNSLQTRMAEIAGLQKAQLDSFAKQLVLLTQANDQKLGGMRDTIEHRLNALMAENGRRLDQIREETGLNAKQQREEMASSLKGFNDSISERLQKLTESNENKLELVRSTVEAGLKQVQDDNSRQLEQMRATVDEKLQGTLEKRLGESFKQVSERLEQVHRGLGEMQTLATGVGDLKRALTNVKTRGGWGEIQLASLLEEILSPEQYERNVRTRESSGEMVEFAIKLPGREDGNGSAVWLPVDAKFPIEDYHRLIDAQERADAEAADAAAKSLMVRIKGCAKDICDKYISPPKTTDFAIMFLPTEGLYAEVVRRSGIVESIQRDCRVVIAGPTTFAALLNSLQMGFRTLAIQKRSSEVWKLLGAVKAEFGKFGTVLDGVKKKLDQASHTMDDAAKRSRAIERKLRGVEELPASEAQLLLAESSVDLEAVLD